MAVGERAFTPAVAVDMAEPITVARRADMVVTMATVVTIATAAIVLTAATVVTEVIMGTADLASVDTVATAAIMPPPSVLR